LNGVLLRFLQFGLVVVFTGGFSLDLLFERLDLLFDRGNAGGAAGTRRSTGIADRGNGRNIHG